MNKVNRVIPRRKSLTLPNKTLNGYVQIFMPEHHRADRSGYVLEHIVIAEKSIGRKIFKDEAVHHKDRNKGNNDPDNLSVMSHSEHSRIHSTDRKGKKHKKRFRSVSSREENSTSYEPLKKEKLPPGYYYLRTIKNKRKTKKIEDNC